MNSSKPKPIKVLNALSQLSSGAMESLLVETLRHVDRDEVHMDFLVSTEFEGYFDATVKAMGARVILGKERFSPRRNLKELAAINKRFGPYDVLHCHRHFKDAPLLKAAKQIGIPIRISHAQVTHWGAKRSFDRLRVALARRMIRKYGTHGLAVCRSYAASLFGSRWERDPHNELLQPGCNFDAFRTNGARKKIRRELAIKDDDVAIVHVGNFTNPDTYEFIVGLGSALEQSLPQFRIVLVGDGPLLSHVDWQVKLTGLSDNIMFLATPPSVPELFLAMDAFILPTDREDFSLAAIEAQAAGLVCFLADAVVPEVEIVPELLHRIPTAPGPEHWANEVTANYQATINQESALAQCLANDRGIAAYIERLRSIYEDR